MTLLTCNDDSAGIIVCFAVTGLWLLWRTFLWLARRGRS